MDSSLIFLVIIGLWAAYLVPHWLRRREQLSASRSVDRFSAAMRVLARRSDLPARDRRPASRSYVLMPPREAVRDVVVKRARPVDDGRSLPRATDVPPLSRRPSPGRRRSGSVMPLVLLGLVVATPLLAALGLAGVVPAWSSMVPLVAAVAMVVALRASAVRRRAGLRVAPARRPGQPAPTATIKELRVDQGFPARAAVHASPAEPSATERDLDLWTPVPVPPPTYTLKPQAPPRRLAPPPAPQAEHQPEPAPAAEPPPAAALDLDAVLERRRASGE